MKKIPGLEERLKLLEKLIEETMTGYKNDIILLQFEKDKIIKQKMKEIDAGQEKFVEQSKGLISEFKRKFKKFIASIPQNITSEEIEKEIGIKSLKDKLYEIEIYVKQKMADSIKEFENSIKMTNSVMGERTAKLKDELDIHKKTLKESLTNLINDLNSRIEVHNEELEKIKEGNNDDRPVNKSIDELVELFEDPDLISDVEKITEIYDDKIAALKETLDQTRTNATEKYFKNLYEKEYYRNRKRIEDINEIHDMYKKKLEEASK